MTFLPNQFFNQIKTAITLLCVSGTAVSLLAAPKEINRISAVVNGEPITQLEVESALQMQVRIFLMENRGVSRDQVKRAINKMEGTALDELINQKLIISEFKRLGGEIKSQYIDESIDRFVKTRFGGDKAKFSSELKKSGMTIAQFRDVQRDQIAVQALTAQNVKIDDGTTILTRKEKKQKYNEIKGKYATKGRVKVWMMAIPKKTADSSMADQKALANRIRSKIVNGASFGPLAKEHSDDSFASKGGYVGAIGSGTLNEGLTQLAFNMSPGQVSKLLDDGPYWRIMKVGNRVGQSVPNEKKLEKEIEQRLKGEKYKAKRDQWLKKLRRDANVKVYD